MKSSKREKLRHASTREKQQFLRAVQDKAQAILRRAVKLRREVDFGRVAADIALMLKELGCTVRSTIKVWRDRTTGWIRARLSAVKRTADDKTIPLNKYIITYAPQA